MGIRSVSGMVCYVEDPLKTAEFYEKLGFQFKKRKSHHVTVNLNWYWIDFLKISKEEKTEFIEEARSNNKGAGIYIYVSVDNVDEFYNDLIAKGLKPSTEPRDCLWNREFVIAILRLQVNYLQKNLKNTLTNKRRYFINICIIYGFFVLSGLISISNATYEKPYKTAKLS